MMACCQIALSSMDLTRSHAWYRHALGFLVAGERRHLEGPVFAAIPGLSEASFDVWCLVGRRDFVQFEIFEFARPVMRPRPTSWRACDIGYSMFAVRVQSFDGVLGRLAAAGTPLLAP